MGFCSASRTGERIPFRNRHIEVRIFAPQPGTPAFHQAPRETRKWARNPGFSRIRFVSGLPVPLFQGGKRQKSPALSGNSFAETIGRNGFDQDCRPRPAVQFCALITFQAKSIAIPSRFSAACNATLQSIRIVHLPVAAGSAATTINTNACEVDEDDGRGLHTDVG